MGDRMSDVEATRYMASERDLEFVDLDTYGVDPAAAAILPADLSRHHRVVAVKRKFGTPVIATADPDDLLAVDSIRALLGGTSSPWSPRPSRSTATSTWPSTRDGAGGHRRLAGRARRRDRCRRTMPSTRCSPRLRAARPPRARPCRHSTSRRPTSRHWPRRSTTCATGPGESGRARTTELADLARSLEQSGDGAADADRVTARRRP